LTMLLVVSGWLLATQRLCDHLSSVDTTMRLTWGCWGSRVLVTVAARVQQLPSCCSHPMCEFACSLSHVALYAVQKGTDLCCTLLSFCQQLLQHSDCHCMTGGGLPDTNAPHAHCWGSMALFVSCCPLCCVTEALTSTDCMCLSGLLGGDCYT
jgi:hypothetical protein